MKKTVDGLILREVPLGEYDKLLTVLTARDGQVLMTAKGARSMHSKVMPVCRLFTYANLEYYERNDRRWVSGGSVNDSFFGLNEDLEGFSLASYLLQVATEITGEGVPADEILRMTLNTLYLIEKKGKPYEQIKGVYEWFAAKTSGFEPDLSGCAECRCGGGEDLWLDVMNGHLICSECLRKRAGNLALPELDAYQARNILLPLDPSTLASLRYVTVAPLSRIFAFSLTEESLACFGRVTETYLLNHLERSFDALEFYHSVRQPMK
ncbi:MAG: DNA repair protein RecO [Clostridia bacterium]|nr:DNA repair protein RecO [Clostridia bacterium]